MRRLQGVDGWLWYNETPTNHMHTLKVMVINPSRSDVPYSYERFIHMLDERLHLVPSFRWRLLETPGGLHHPVWVEDPDFDINRHFHRSTAEAPGGPKEMDEAIGRVAGSLLPHDRPLWEVHLIDGLANGRVAVVTKVHHAMADGGAAANQLLNIADDPQLDGVPPPLDPWKPGPLPSRRKLVMSALAAHPAQARSLPGLIRKTLAGRRATKEYWQDQDEPRVRPWSGPKTFLNSTIDNRRGFATTSIPLADVQALRQNTDYTLNDIVVAVYTGALRRILSDRGELPDGPLVAIMPAATGQRTDRIFGNAVGIMFTGVPVHMPGQDDRLEYIHRNVSAARKANQLAGPELLDEWFEFIPPKLFAWGSRFIANSKRVASRTPMKNVAISNVRGPGTELSIGGYPIEELFSCGPLDIGMALNVTVWSYAGRFNFTALSCPVQLPDPHLVTDALQASFQELRDHMNSSNGSRTSQESTALKGARS